jgi:diguanylate cyclase (GGDEF)-like protein
MSETSGDKQRLLIVDDSKVIRVTARKILQNHFETVEAVDGNNAWEILESHPPFSLIISDLTMPNLDGFGLLQKIRGSTQPHIRNIPVIIITGANDSDATMQRATAAGATDFIGKPFDSVHLLARTRSHATAYEANNTLTEENLTLEDHSLSDPLTGLANDTALTEKGHSQLAYAIRHDTTLALAGIEIDAYGELVRSYGEDAGEAVIKSVAQALQANIRKEDLVARTGTARFALLLPGMDTGGVNRLSARITGDIGKHAVTVGGRQVPFTVSIGIATPDIRPDTSFDELLTAAAASLKEAMARGGNRVLPEVPPADGGETQAPEAWMLEPAEQKVSCTTHDDEGLPDSGVAEPAAAALAQPGIEELVLEAEPPTTLDEVAAAARPDEIMTDLQDNPVFGEIALEGEVTVLDDLDLDAEPQATISKDPSVTPSTGAATESSSEEMDETIVITSPYNLFDLDEVELDSTAAGSGAETGTDAMPRSDAQPAPAAIATAARPLTTPATANPGVGTAGEKSRPGILRRLLGALFGRRD